MGEEFDEVTHAFCFDMTLSQCATMFTYQIALVIHDLCTSFYYNRHIDHANPIGPLYIPLQKLRVSYLLYYGEGTHLINMIVVTCTYPQRYIKNLGFSRKRGILEARISSHTPYWANLHAS